jgi:hypothetical protein
VARTRPPPGPVRGREAVAAADQPADRRRLDVARLTDVSPARACAAVARLVEAEVLRPITESKRDMTWAAGEVLDEADLMVDRLRFG